MTSILKPTRAALLAVLIATAMGCDAFVDDQTRIDRASAHIEAGDYRTAEIELKNVLRSNASNLEARIMLGEVLLATGNVDGAIKELRRAREMNAPIDDYVLPLARALVRNGDTAQVVALDPERLLDDDDRAELIALIGLAELGRGNLGPARERLEAAQALDADQPEALLGLARIARQRGELDVAGEYLERLLAAHPDHHAALATQAALQTSRGEHAQAEQTLRRALEAASKPGEAAERLEYRIAISETHIARGDFAAAGEAAAEAMATSNDHPAALMQAARTDLMAGDYDGVIEKTDRIITVVPQYVPPRLLLAAAALAQNNSSLAATHLETALQNEPGNEAARKLLAQARMALGSPDGALEVLQPLLEAGADDPQLLAMAGTASLQTGDEAAGLDLMQRGVAASSDDPRIMLQAAANFLAAGEINQAVELLEKMPSSADVGQRELLLILALLRKGDRDQARAQAEAILEARPGDPSAHRLMGGFHLAVGEFDEAAEQFGKALEIDPDDIAATVHLARIDLERENIAGARARFEALLTRNPGNLTALTALAQIAERNGEGDAAVAYLERARETNPDSPDAAASLARYYLVNGQTELGAERAEQAVRIAPNSPIAHLLLGTARVEQDRPAEALASFERTVELAPNNAVGHYQLGRAHERMGKFDAAYQSYERAVELQPDLHPARAGMVTATVRRGDFGRALEILDDLDAALPDSVDPLILRGDIEMARGDAAAALTAYERAAAIAPSRDLAVKRARVLRQLGRKGFWTVLDDWVSDNPDDTEARLLLAEALNTAGYRERARAELVRVHTAAPSAQTAVQLANFASQSNDFEGAREWLDKALELDPRSFPARGALASIELASGNSGKALSIVRKLQAERPDLPQPFRVEGDALLAQEKWRAAIDAYRRAQAIEPRGGIVARIYVARRSAGDSDAWHELRDWFKANPTDFIVAMELAQHHSGAGDTNRAIEIYETVVEGQPDNVIALNNLAWLYYQRSEPGDLARGLRIAARAYGQRGDVGAIADTYGWLLLQDGQVNEARATLEKAAAAAPENPEIGYHYAVALHRAGDTSRARELLDRLLAAESPGFDSRDEARRLRSEL